MSALTIAVTDTPAQDDLDRIGKALATYNDGAVGPADRRPIAVLVHDGPALVAGISGYTAWGWLYTQWLWIAESERGRGLAGRMLAAAEAEAKARGCHGATIDTFNPQALRVYERAGYVVFGTLPDFPRGHTRSFLSKTLT